MSSPAYVTLDGSSSVLPSIGKSFFLKTSGGPREITGIEGGFQDGDEVKLANNGPDNIVLRHDAGSPGNSLFLSGNVDRTILPNGQFTWYIRSPEHPLGNGWANGEDPA
jgi:hypothetical protein